MLSVPELEAWGEWGALAGPMQDPGTGAATSETACATGPLRRCGWASAASPWPNDLLGDLRASDRAARAVVTAS